MDLRRVRAPLWNLNQLDSGIWVPGCARYGKRKRRSFRPTRGRQRVITTDAKKLALLEKGTASAVFVCLGSAQLVKQVHFLLGFSQVPSLWEKDKGEDR